MREKSEQVIPKATAKRLPLYYRHLQRLKEQDICRTNSKELADALAIDSATIRRDFSYFGELGKRGYGYNVDDLTRYFAKILKEDEQTNVALIGVGNLGTALIKYKFHRKNNLRISAAFDLKDNPYVGKILDGVPVYDIDELKEHIQAQRIEVAILSVPAQAAEGILIQLIDAGVKGILNFTTERLSAPEGIIIQSVDLTNELQTLIYFLRKNELE
ncbi:MAG: redox-sensing transcriptional repressor Rex [Streptococcaceae bacterium]|nr:redox-sensing transcriptional repressor Rex [Streptococcaceae bacterium]MCH4176399.1 redox-sensing transcriptional repressor Rex [Streptococcaceae bacterium]